MANIAVSNTQAVVGSFTQAELDTLRGTIAVGTSNEQFALFVQTCVNSGLNPFLNHIYCIVYGNKMSIQVSVEGILYLARQKDGYKGVDVQTVHENDDFEAERTNEGEWVIKSHKIKFPRGKVVGCYAVALREGFKDVVVFMETNEVDHMKNGNNKAMWNNWYNDMFKKHVTKRAAKMQYGIEINEDEQIGSSAVEQVESYQPGQRKDVTPHLVEIGEGEIVDPQEELKNKWSAIRSKMKDYNLTEDDLKTIISNKFTKKAKELNLQDLVALSKFVDLEHAAREKAKQEEPAAEQKALDMDFEEEFE